MQRKLKMRQKLVSLLLCLVMAVPMLPLPASVAGSEYQASAIPSDYFYNQLNERAKAIYDKLLDEFSGPRKKDYYTGTAFIDLMDLTVKNGDTVVISDQDVEDYKAGNKDIFNDFTAAKDALDLDHSELWYIDSGYLTFRVTQEEGKYHVLIGPGRGETYLLAGEALPDVENQIAATDAAVNAIVEEAVKTLNEAQAVSGAEFSEQDQKAALITAVHDLVVRKIHYRYEIECRDGGANAKYIRTLHGIVTHEGVCEAYARTLQVCLTKLGIECVLIHGVQTKGTPEDHMWNAVNIPENDEDHWYVVDATWDDPLTANWDGTRDLTFKDGLDGKETNTYLMVGQSLVGEYWRPSGFVSTGNFEFQYPTIETAAYSGSTAFGDDNGLKVKYSAGGSQEDGVPAGVYTVTFKGWNAEQAASHGFYFMLKMYDYHPDGTASVMNEWYYANATLIFTEKNPYFGDFEDGLRFSSATCEYVEVAVTSRQPSHFDEWSKNPSTNYLTKDPDAGYFQGDESEIVAQSGMLYNVNSKYEAPPYVLSQTPAPNGNSTAGYNYRFKVTFDDDLYHILPSDVNALNGIATAANDNFKNDYERARQQKVQVRYATNQQDLHNDGAVIATQVAGELPFDVNRDGIVDMEGDYTDFRWIYKSDPVEQGGQGVVCPNEAHHKDGHCDVTMGCPIIGVEFNFRASDQWIDDVTEYNFSIEGVVGSRSSKYPNNFATIAIVPGLCPACYRSQGIDWNLWGQPTLLDAPENLDLHAMAEAGGTDPKTLEELDKEMNTSGLNGRLMLVVENKSKGAGNREDYEKINDFLEKEEKEELEGEVIGSSVFEINFNRICPMVKLKPNAGQSLRVQVGYPAGVTYESLGSGDVELKAYHFTRCDPANEKDHPCPNSKKEGHKWGDDIVAVNEITIIPTPYGMVIMCDAFSPFEIVAVRKTGNPSASDPAAKTTHTVVVVSDMNGVVEYKKNDQTVKAVGEDGNVEFKEGESITFTVKPDAGYAVDTVSLGGEEITVTNGTFTVDNVTESDVLSVTFLPEKVEEQQKSEYGTTVVAEVCTHSTVEKVPDAEHDKDIPATCTTKGYELGTKCTQCGQTMTEGHETPATGHTIDENDPDCYEKGTAATCTEDGVRDYIKCTVCGDVLSDREVLPALGHVFTKYEEGDKTCQGLEMTAVCDRCHDATETKTDPADAIDHEYVSTGKVEATCTQNAAETFKCKWCDETKTVEQPGTMTEHKPDETGRCEVCGKYVCEDGHHYVTTEAKDPTCTEEGHTAGKQCSVCGHWETPEKIIPALGHRFNGHTAGSKCEVCGVVMTQDEHTPVAIPDVEATCEKEGTKGGKKCEFCGQILEQPEIIPAKGHSWDTDHPEWTWTTEGDVSASVTLTCKNDSTHRVTFAATVHKDTTTKKPTCTQPGAAIYTATATVGKTTITATYTVELPMTEHTFGSEPVSTTPTTCTHHGTKTYACTVCGFEKTETEEGDLLPHEFVPDPSKSKLAGCTTDGLSVGYCVYCHEEQSVVIPATGHSWNTEKAEWRWYLEDGVSARVLIQCDNCAETHSVDATVKIVKTVNSTCTEDGFVTYEATATYDGKVLTDLRTIRIGATGHSWNTEKAEWTWTTEGKVTATFTVPCDDCDETQTPAVTVAVTETVDATCTEGGHVTYKATATFGGKTFTDTKTVTVPATGHSWNTEKAVWTWSTGGEVTATFTVKCDVCGETQSPKVTVEITKTVDATCTENGSVTYTATATFNGKTFTDTKTVTVPATGHSWNTENAKWTWSDEGEVTATFTVPCDNCDEVQTPEVTVKITGTADATCTEDGSVTYTATATFNGKTFTDTKTVTVPATGHSWNTEKAEWTWSTEDGASATVTVPCDDCDKVQTPEVTVKITGTVDATCTEDGSVTYTATATFNGKTFSDTKTVTVPALGHSWNTEKAEWAWSTEDGASATVTVPCDRCDETQKPAVTVKETGKQDATCTEDGSVTYTATATFDGETLTDTKTVTVPKTGHSAEKVEAKAPTATEEGNIEYWYCAACGKYFKDADLTEEITKDQTVVAATGSDQPSDPTDQPSEPTDQPSDPTDQPSEPTDQPSEPTDQPSEPTDQPSDPTDQPSEPTQPSRPSIPPTADDNSAAILWIVLAGVSAAVLAVLTLGRKRRRNGR